MSFWNKMVFFNIAVDLHRFYWREIPKYLGIMA